VLFWTEEDFKLWIHLRVSARAQSRNLDDQLWSVLAELTARGQVSFGISCEIDSGWRGPDRVIFSHAASHAAAINAMFVTETVCRVIRPITFHTKNAPHATPSSAELEWTKEATRGMQLVTILPPRTDWQLVRAYQTRRAGFRKRLDKSALRAIARPHVVNLVKEGWRVRRIARLLGINESTLRSWL
jgi:hypothetical protein